MVVGGGGGGGALPIVSACVPTIFTSGILCSMLQNLFDIARKMSINYDL